MKTAAIAAALLVVAACGSAKEQASGGDKEAQKPTASPSETVCVTVSGVGRRLATVDLDKDGTREIVHLFPQGEGCPAALIVDGGSPSQPGPQVSLPDGEPPVTSAFAVAPSWSDGQLLVTRAEHPRGGYQLRIYAVDGESLTELTVDGQPLVPFVATDVAPGKALVDCSQDGFVVGTGAQARAYTVNGTDVTAGTPVKTAGGTVGQPAFASCRVAG